MLVAIDCRQIDARVTLRTVREHAPAARIVAWLEPDAAARVSEMLSLGYDDVAIGALHLEHIASRALAEHEIEQRFGRQMTMHAGLVKVVSEIASNPELQAVLHLSVLRISISTRAMVEE